MSTAARTIAPFSHGDTDAEQGSAWRSEEGAGSGWLGERGGVGVEHDAAALRWPAGPEAKVAQDLLDRSGILDDRDQPHLPATAAANQNVLLPGARSSLHHASPGTDYIPGMPPWLSEDVSTPFFGLSAMSASVVIMSDATDAAFWSAERTTLVGSMTPASMRSS
jgi:hypothetical protein